jgi:hypothetical protein
VEECIYEDKNLMSERKAGRRRDFMLLDNIENK